MVELQSCASLVNASSLCAIEQEVKGEGVNVIAEITAELERERRKNAELLERISILEAQIQERNKESLPTNGQVRQPSSYLCFCLVSWFDFYQYVLHFLLIQIT